MDRRFLQEISLAASPLPLPPLPPLSAPAPYPHPYIQTLSADQAILYALVVTAVVLMALCLMVRALVLRMTGRLPYSRQLAAQQAAFQADQAWPGQPSFLPGLNPISTSPPPPKLLVASFPQFKYTQEESERISESTCVVCLEEYVAGDKLLLLPECNHVFHLACIEGWFQHRTNCPVCRVSLLPKDNQIPDTAPNFTPPSQEIRPLVRGNPSRFIFSRPATIETPDQSTRL